MTTARRHHRLHYVAAIGWLLATVSLASWWLAHGISTSPNLRRMFEYEGATFIALLVGGGIVILVAIRREHLRRDALETFFLSFTHDLKTSLASLQLQAEGLREDWPETLPRQPLDRLLTEALRLQIQLENSLFVAQPDGRLLTERIDAATAIQRLTGDWPDLSVRVQGQAAVIADARGFEVVLRNLLQNAVIHGGAHEVRVDVEPRQGDGVVRLTVADDGRGVPPEVFAGLGQPFARGGHTSGTGMGLFVCRQLVARMNGVLQFVPPASAGRGLTVVLDLPGPR